MQRYSAQTKDKGFTLTEMLVTVIVAGVLAAISAPSLVGMINRNQVKDAQRQVESALKEAQRQAMRRGKSCSIVVDTSNKKISSPDRCLLSVREFGKSTLIGGDKVSIKANDGAANTISFSNKGIPNPAQKVIVIDSSFSDVKKCVAIVDGIGTIRTGNYTGNVGTTLDIANCIPAD